MSRISLKMIISLLLTGLLLTSAIRPSEAPAALDYRKSAVSVVKDQGRCGSCWAFASIGSLEESYAIKYGKVFSLSAQQLNDCLKSSGLVN